MKLKQMTSAIALAFVPTGVFAQLNTATLAEMQSLATAMDIVFLDTQFYTTIENLDDTLNSSANPDFQYVNNGGGALVFRPAEGDTFRRNLTGSEWQGPYLAGGGLLARQERPGGYQEAVLKDPFGNPYYFYTPLGLVDPETGSISLKFYGDDFDRYTIVSHGADGMKSGDDLFYEFGGTITARTISSARLSSSVTRGTGGLTLTIKGYNLGSTQGTSAVYYNGAPATNLTITSWTSTLVVASLSAPPPVGATISANVAGGQTRSVTVTDETEPVGVKDWMDFY